MCDVEELIAVHIHSISSKPQSSNDKNAAPDAKADQLASQFPNGSWFEVYDYGVGDDVIWPYSVSVVLSEDGTYQIKSPVPVKISLPKGSKQVYVN